MPRVGIIHASILDRILHGCGSQLLYVENVLFPSTCEFILDKVLFGYHDGPDFPIDQAFDSILPSLIKTDAVEVLRILSRQSAEDFRVVLWRTRFEPKGVYATVYEPGQFSGLAGQITEQPALKEVLREAALLLKQQFSELNKDPRPFVVSGGTKLP
jgi:hypothetical protein